jgi:hypothetical protein
MIEILDMINNHRKFKLLKSEYLIDILTSPPGYREEDWEDFHFLIVQHRILSIDRWTSKNRVVLKINGVLYIVYYRTGLTEYQDTRPWEYDEYIEFFPAVEKVITDFAEVL